MALASARAETSFKDELGIRLWGGLFKADMYDMQRFAMAQNDQMVSGGWEGDFKVGNLTRGAGAGIELSWGVLPDVRVVAAVEGRGVSAGGDYRNVAGQEATLSSGLSACGVEGGATFLLRSFEDWCRINLTVRAGAHRLYWSYIGYEETGPSGDISSSTKLQSMAPGGMVGLEWEWLTPVPSLPFPLTGFILAGYRFLSFSKIDYVTDSGGTRDTGVLEGPDGKWISMDFSGPEVRFGLQIVLLLKQ